MIRAPLWSLPAAAALFVIGVALSSAPSAQEQAPAPLKEASSFDDIADEGARSIALFEEAGKVILHPRCVNCHPAGNVPMQGMDMRPHQPPVTRGEADIGVPGMMCMTCHGAENFAVVGQAETIRSIPGNPAWHLAPIEMAWEGKTLGEICEQLKDRARNGGRSLVAIVDHMTNDDLVGWGWSPGEGREPVPGTQAIFGELIRYWVETGAACPA